MQTCLRSQILSPNLYQAITVLMMTQKPDSAQPLVESRSVFVTHGTLIIPK